MSQILDVVYDNGVLRTAEPFVPSPLQKLQLLVADAVPRTSGTIDMPQNTPSEYPFEDLGDFPDYGPVPGKPAGSVLVRFVDGGKMPPQTLDPGLWE